MKEKLVITMNKIAKILSAVLSVTLVIGVTVAMLVSAFAASAPKFSVNVISETKDEVKVAFTLVDGSFTAIDFRVNASDWDKTAKNTGLTLDSIEKSQAYKDFANDQDVDPIYASNKKNGKVSFASVNAYDAKGDVFIFTFTKTSSAKEKIVASDIVATIESCTDADNKDVTASVANNIPTEVPSEKPSEEPSEKPSEKPSKVDVVTTAPAADTTTAASSSDVVNPETGDRLTATAAVVSLLAISGAAVVALRKKED